MGNPYFHFKAFSIFRQEKGLKLTTDACILGAVASQPNALQCLDIGTGTGVLSLMLAQKYPESQITAVEISENVAHQAEYNFSQSVFKDRIKLHTCDILNFNSIHPFDLIICNPPYFTNHLKGSDALINTAMHTEGLVGSNLIATAKRLLRPGGTFWIIYPPNEAENALIEADKNNFICRLKLLVFNKPGKHFRTVLCLKRETGSETNAFAYLPQNVQNLLLHNETGTKTEAFYRLMEPFYLENTEPYKRPFI